MSSSEILCVRCNKPTHSRFDESIPIDECRDCGGIWFDAGELSACRDQANPDLSWMDIEPSVPYREAVPERCFDWLEMDYISDAESGKTCATLQCPKCRVPLFTVNYKDTTIQIDFCNQCEGVWLDKGELEKIIKELEERLHLMSVQEFFQESLKEAKEIMAGPETVISEWRDLSIVVKLLHSRILAKRPAIGHAIEILRGTLSFIR